MNKKSILTLLIAIVAIGGLFAQQPDPAEGKKEKKVIIIKTIDENGNEKVEEIIVGGEEGETNFWINEEGETIEINVNGSRIKIIEEEDLEGLEEELIELEEKRIEVEVEVERIMEEIEKEMEEVEKQLEEMEIKVIMGEEGEEPHIIKWNSKGKEPLSEEQLKELEEKGIFLEDFAFLHGEPKAFLGVMISQTDENKNGVSENSGVVVTELVEDGPALKAGIEEGDVIKGLDGNSIAEMDELLSLLGEKKPGDTVELEVDRGGNTKTISVTLGEKQAHKVHDLLWIDEEGEEGETKIIIIEGANGKKIKKKKKKTSKMIEIEEEDFDVELGGDLSLNDLKIGPNPSSDVVSLAFSTQEKGDLDIQVLNLNGQTVYKEFMSDFSGDYSSDLDLSGQATGTYLLKIQQGKKQWIEEIILQ